MKASHMVDILEKIKRDAKENPYLPYLNLGICTAAKELGAAELCTAVFEPQDFSSWPKYSGRPCFPIPSTLHKYKALGIEDGAGRQWQRTKPGKAYWTGSYGKLRFQLLNHLIRRYKAKAKQE